MPNAPELNRPPADVPPGVQGQQVSLGCGTLILIALIVLIFGRSGTENIEREVRGLRSEVNELRTAVVNQTVQIKALQNVLEKVKE